MANGSEGAPNIRAAQLVSKAHLRSARESSQETEVEQFPDLETSATSLLVDGETSSGTHGSLNSSSGSTSGWCESSSRIEPTVDNFEKQ